MDRLETYIKETIAPKIQGDGGWIELISCEEKKAVVRLQGECSKCAIVPKCMTWIENEVKRDLELEVKIEAERKKPFFWDAV